MKKNVQTIAPKAHRARAASEEVQLQKSPAGDSTIKPRELSPAQQQVADLVADIIVNGAHRDEAWKLLMAICRFRERPSLERWFEGGLADFHVKLDGVATLHAEGLLKALQRDWQKQQTVPRDEQREAKTVTERVRANYRGQLRRAFEEFLECASAEEIVFAHSVFTERSAGGLGEDQAEFFQSLALADAFHVYLTDKSAQYICIPESMRFEAIDTALRTAASLVDKQPVA